MKCLSAVRKDETAEEDIGKKIKNLLWFSENGFRIEDENTLEKGGWL